MDSPHQPGPSSSTASSTSWNSRTHPFPTDFQRKNVQKTVNFEEVARQEDDESIGEGHSDLSVAGPSTSASNESAPAYDVFSPEQIASQMENIIKEIQGIIPQPSETIRLLLNDFAWNKEQLLDVYFDNAEKLLADIETRRIENPPGGESSKSTHSSTSEDQNEVFQMKSFVKSNPSFKWCPNPFCTKAIKVTRINEKDSYIKCDCGHAFCFLCEAYAHAPVTCDMLRKWNTKRHTELESLTSHENELKVEKSRFMRYLSFFIDHAKLLKQERKLYENLVKYEDPNKTMRFVEVHFLKDAIDTVLQCRLAVMHTYVFEYYVDHSKQTEKFSKNRDDLQGAVERLSELLRDITNSDRLSRVKIDVQNMCTYSQSLRQVLINFVNEEYSEKVEDGGA